MDKSASLAMYQYLVKTGGNFEQERKRAGQEETLVDNLDNNIVTIFKTLSLEKDRAKRDPDNVDYLDNNLDNNPQYLARSFRNFE